MRISFAFRGRARATTLLLASTFLTPTLLVAQEAERLPDIMVTAPRTNFYENPTGQTKSTIEAERLTNTRAFSVTDVLADSPGVDMKQGNGPRDIGISIRGSNARNGFGIRNITIFEDGFPVTQPDGLSRTDLIDPHSYSGIDVVRGPSSSLFGNYATGGSINFRTRTGGEINGYEFGQDVGSYGYHNSWGAVGKKSGDFEGSLFFSDVRGDGSTSHSSFNTQTFNFLGTWTPTPEDKITVKAISNWVYGNLSVRLSLNQFNQNPYQRGCFSATAAAIAAGCGSVSVFNNGFAGAKSNLSADEAGLHRQDRRSILGMRWEHNFGADTTWRTQVVLDDRNITQPTGATSAIGDYPSINLMTDVTSRGQIAGLPATHFLGAFYNRLSWSGDTFNVMPGGNATMGALTQNIQGTHENYGLRAREEIKFHDDWTFVTGIGVERTNLTGRSSSYAYSAAGVPTLTQISSDRDFLNIAPEAAVLWRANQQVQFRARVATGYGTPQVGNLFVTPAGLVGSNTQLQSQTNLGYDIGADWTPLENLKLSVTGFYEFFRNELVTQSPGPSPLQSFTFNAPRSEHRGVELSADWRFLPGWKATAAYSYDDQVYTEYSEQLSAGAFTSVFNRAGNKIPGVPPNQLLARLGYDHDAGPLKGLGAYVEYVYKDSFFMDNANLLKAPGYGVANFNLHYTREFNASPVKSLSAFFEVRNIFDKTYVASANNLSDSLNAATGAQNPASVLAAATGSIYAGTPRTFIGGVKVKF